MKVNIFFSILILTLTTYSCRKDPKVDTIYEYSFFVAGHTYGSPLTPSKPGLHNSFTKHMSFLNNYQKLNFGVLTGDVVSQPTQQFWNAARLQLNHLTMPIHIAAGNHDRGQVFESLYQYYYSFETHGDLFIILNSNGWNIITQQKTFLEQTIKDRAEYVKNIFVFTHELIWWTPTNKFGHIKINSSIQYPGNTNFSDEIFPMFDTLKNNITFFAGDLGATDKASPYMYFKDENITYIASGMGNGDYDNMVILEVDSENTPHYKFYGLNKKNPFIIEYR